MPHFTQKEMFTHSMWKDLPFKPYQYKNSIVWMYKWWSPESFTFELNTGETVQCNQEDYIAAPFDKSQIYCVKSEEISNYALQ